MFATMLLVRDVSSDTVVSLPLAFTKDHRERHTVAVVHNLPNTVTI